MRDAPLFPTGDWTGVLLLWGCEADAGAGAGEEASEKVAEEIFEV